jgi:F-type H+-transporting ATPase subunit gamma
MANLKEVRNRITSVNSTKQITSAMKMVSAAKLRRAQDAITRMRPYAEKLQAILSNVSGSLDSSEGLYTNERPVQRVLAVCITSNRGLAGAFNSQVIRLVRTTIQEETVPVDVLCVGKKGNDYFNKTDNYASDFPTDLAKLYDDLTFTAAGDIAQMVMDSYVEGKYDKVILCYNKFKNAAVQVVTGEQFLPVLPPEPTANASSTDHIMEPSRGVIIEEVVPRSLKTQFFKAVLDSNAAEHGARMTAMHKATDNADSLLKDLKLSYNKARQAAITNEILEIVAGAEALNG